MDPKKGVFKAGLELAVRHKLCGLQGKTPNTLPYNQTLPKHRGYNEPESSDQTDTPEKSTSVSFPLKAVRFRCVAPAAVPGSREGRFCTRAQVGEQVNNQGTHTHTHSLPLSAPSLRSVYCAQSAAGFNNPLHRSSSSPPRPHLGSSPRAAPRRPRREPCFSDQAFRPQIRQEFEPGDPPPTKDTRVTLGFCKNFQTRQSGLQLLSLN